MNWDGTPTSFMVMKQIRINGHRRKKLLIRAPGIMPARKIRALEVQTDPEINRIGTQHEKSSAVKDTLSSFSELIYLSKSL